MMPRTPELLDALVQDDTSPEDRLGEDGLLQQVTNALVERTLQGELTHHLGYEQYAPEGKHTGNARNDASPKTITGKRGQVQIQVRGTALAHVHHT